MFWFIGYVIEPNVSFVVTGIEEKKSCCIIEGNFVEKKPVLEEAVKEFEQACLKKQGKSTAAETGPKYAESSPTSLSEIFEFDEKSYEIIPLEEAIKKAKFSDPDKLIAVGMKKKEDLKRISKDFDLTKTDIMSIFIYTFEKEGTSSESPYYVVNRALAMRSKEDLLPKREYIFYLLTALRKLPMFRKQKVLYRGIMWPDANVRDTYYEGRTLSWTSFSSTSTDESTAYEFVEDSKNGVIFEIHGKFRGYSIGTFSDYGDEEGK